MTWAAQQSVVAVVWVSSSWWAIQSKSIFPKNKLKCGPVSTREHVSTVFWSISDDLGAREHFCTKNFLLCIIQFQVAFLDAEADCVEWQWFSKVLLSPCGYVHHCSMTVFPNNTAWGPRWSHAFNSNFRPWPLRTEISPDSLNLFTILWTVDGERPKFFAILHYETLSFCFASVPTFFECVAIVTFCSFFYIYKIQWGLQVKTLKMFSLYVYKT